MKYQFIKEHRNEFTLLGMCRVLNIKKCSYYAWRSRPICNRKKEDMELLKEIKIIHKKSKQVYGSPKIHEELINMGKNCGHNRVARIMRENGIKSKIVKKYKHKGSSVSDKYAAPNILNRNFNPEKKNMVWALDITYLWTRVGWVYLCVCMDLFHKKIVGWSVSKRAKAEIAVKALIMAIRNCKPEKGLIVHSDRGSQFGSNIFKDVIERHKFIQSMSRKGNCWDNACVESFFGKLKVEHFNDIILKSVTDAEYEAFCYIEGFYNRYRRHASLGYLTPVEYEKKVA
jgi:putative transposase